MSSDRLQRTLGVLLLAVTDLKVLGGVKKKMELEMTRHEP